MVRQSNLYSALKVTINLTPGHLSPKKSKKVKFSEKFRAKTHPVLWLFFQATKNCGCLKLVQLARIKFAVLGLAMAQSSLRFGLVKSVRNWLIKRMF